LGLRYSYVEEITVQTAPVLAADRMAVLPETTREELKEALESLEIVAIAAAIRQVEDWDAELAKVLSNRADNFDYQAILDVLHKVSS
jgi:folate-dependent phosphoribosylglycinamide formyltransferase PurN